MLRVTETLRTKIGLFIAKTMAITALLLAAVFVHRMAGFNARCYSSQIIDRLVLFSERQEIPNCRRALTDLALGTNLSDMRSDKWGRWTPSLDHLFDIWPKAHRGLAVVMINEEPFAYAQEGNILMLGGAWTSSRRLWSNLVTAAWLAQSTEGMLALEREILSEFLVSLAEGHHEMVGLDQTTIPESQINWANTTLAAKDYCLSPWRRPEEFNNCTTENGENYRPLLSRGLWLIYQQADWRGRRQLLEWLTKTVAQNSESLLAAQPTAESSIEWIKSELARWSEKAQLPVHSFFASTLSSKLGLIQAEKPFVVVEGTVPDSLTLTTQNLLFQNGEQNIWLGPIGRQSPPIRHFKPQHLIKVACQKPALDQVGQWAENTVLLILVCDPNGVRGWELLAQQKIKLFIAENPELPMIWLNVAGLRRTLSEEPQMSASTKPISLKRLRRLSRWKEDLWDKASHTFIPRAAVDLVLSHRASRDLL